jgi:hypothetical protein
MDCERSKLTGHSWSKQIVDHERTQKQSLLEKTLDG